MIRAYIDYEYRNFNKKLITYCEVVISFQQKLMLSCVGVIFS